MLFIHKEKSEIIKLTGKIDGIRNNYVKGAQWELPNNPGNCQGY